MNAQPLAVIGTGLVTAVGLSAPAACAAIRAKLTNPQTTHFSDSSGEPIVACPVTLERSWRGRAKLLRLGAMAASQCLALVPSEDQSRIPLLLCVAEPSRPGRTARLDESLVAELEEALGIRFSEQSAIVSLGRVSIGPALHKARALIFELDAPAVLILGVDSLLTWSQLSAFDRARRLLTPRNSNGFIPGEGAGAVLVGRPTEGPQLLCTGLGFGREASTLEADMPLRAEGLVQAIRGALGEADCGLHDLQFRITDLSGEQYFFKEAALALSRVLRKRMEHFDIWHAAECTGETGAAAGPVAVAVLDAALRKGYAAGPKALFHASNDAEERTAAVFEYGVA